MATKMATKMATRKESSSHEYSRFVNYFDVTDVWAPYVDFGSGIWYHVLRHGFKDT